MDTAFTPAGGTVSGRLSGLETSGGPAAGLGHDVVLNPAPIVDGRYQGSAALVAPGQIVPSAAIVSSSYGGGFFGPDAAETAGTFQIQGNGSIAGGPDSAFDLVGAFGGKKD